LLSAAKGGAEASSPETAPRASLRPRVLHEIILNPPRQPRCEPGRALLHSCVRIPLAFARF